MPQFSPAGIHDAGHRESMSLQLGTPSECNGVGLEDLPSVNLGPAFPVQDSNEGGRDCNVLSRTVQKLDRIEMIVLRSSSNLVIVSADERVLGPVFVSRDGDCRLDEPASAGSDRISGRGEPGPSRTDA